MSVPVSGPTPRSRTFQIHWTPTNGWGQMTWNNFAQAANDAAALRRAAQTRDEEVPEMAMMVDQDTLTAVENNTTTEPVANTHPAVNPKPGALLREISTGNMLYFDGWAADGQIRAHRVDQKRVNNYGADAVEVLTAAIHGVNYHASEGQRTCLFNRAMENIGRADGTLLTDAVDWSGLYVSVRYTGRDRLVQISVNNVAVLAPPLNPATESVEDKLTRLERELAETRQRVHARMVAEGVARDWCAAFDPILDSVGLEKRKRTDLVSGTLTFKDVRVPTRSGRTSVQEMKRNPFGYLNSENVTLTVDEPVPDPQNQLLS